MDDSLMVAATGMNAYERVVEIAAQNAVQAQSPGYLRTRASVQGFGSYMSEASGREQLLGVREDIDFEAGEYIGDDSPFAVAIEGQGFFEVEGPDGNAYYTRNGQLLVDSNGRLSTLAGYPIHGTTDQPIPIDITRGPISIDKNGAIVQGGGEIGRLKLVDFPEDARPKLQRASETLFTAPPDVPITPAKDARVRQKALEIPRYTGAQSMVSMIIAQRAHEAMKKAIGAIADAQERMIRAGQ